MISEAGSYKTLWLPSLSQITCCGRSQGPCHEDAQGAALWKKPHGEERRPLAESHVREPPWKQIL